MNIHKPVVAGHNDNRAIRHAGAFYRFDDLANCTIGIGHSTSYHLSVPALQMFEVIHTG